MAAPIADPSVPPANGFSFMYHPTFPREIRNEIYTYALESVEILTCLVPGPSDPSITIETGLDANMQMTAEVTELLLPHVAANTSLHATIRDFNFRKLRAYLAKTFTARDLAGIDGENRGFMVVLDVQEVYFEPTELARWFQVVRALRREMGGDGMMPIRYEMGVVTGAQRAGLAKRMADLAMDFGEDRPEVRELVMWVGRWFVENR